MLAKIIIRVILGIIFALFAKVIVENNIPPNLPILLPESVSILAVFVFATIGFFTPDLLSVITKLGIARLAEDISDRMANLPKIPQPHIKLPKGVGKNKFLTKWPNPMVFDTSAIIDGRIADIAETGFLTGTVLVLPSVLSELRHIADSGDDLKRARGRQGLEVLNRLRKSKNLKVEVIKNEPEGKEVDEKILNFAQLTKARIVTTDFNLNKVATVSGVKILNVNELSNAVRIVALPGEEMQVKIIHKGKEKDQGVGYLQDGTMIVVEGGSDLVGKTANVKVARILQTVAGRMVFVKPS